MKERKVIYGLGNTRIQSMTELHEFLHDSVFLSEAYKDSLLQKASEVMKESYQAGLSKGGRV